MAWTPQGKLPRWETAVHSNQRLGRREWLSLGAIFFLILLALFWLPLMLKVSDLRDQSVEGHHDIEHDDYKGLALKSIPGHLRNFQQCSIRNLRQDTGLKFLETAKPLPVSEFVARRDRLAKALYEDCLEAFMVEPGYTFEYFANVSCAKS